MSSGVSDQMKVPGNTAKSVEERNIPWSQQVDEASNENLTLPHCDDNSVVYQNPMQFQYPPFNAKDLQNPAVANNFKTRKSYNNFDTSKKHGKPSIHGNAKRDDFPQNAWGSYNTTRRAINDNLPSNFNRNNKSDGGYISGNLDNKGENKKLSVAQVTAAPAPKKTTWASIASQPAKLTSRTTSIASSHKKKGPGMPPPPMVPGKHDLELNTWDMPNNNPPPVPSPPPLPIDQAFAEVTLNNAPGLPGDHVLAVRPDKPHRNSDFHRQDDMKAARGPSAYQVANSFGRSPNGHMRKNWSTQHPLQRAPTNQTNPTVMPPSGPIRRGPDGGSGGSNHMASGAPGGGGVPNSSGNSNRYIVRGGGDRGEGDRSRHSISSRLEYDSLSPSACNYRDPEKAPRYPQSDKARRTSGSVDEIGTESPQAVLDELRDKNNYNPPEIDMVKASSARFFVIKSYSEDDIHRSIKYEIWCSTDHGNKRLDDAFKERTAEGGNILLFFSVNGSGHFCGMAQMMTAVDYNSTSSVWSQDKWRGKFKVKWIYVKDVPNGKFRHIRLENNENKSVTNSRDTQEVPNAKGKEVLQILHSYKHSTSIFDDFYHYEKKQEEEVSSKKPYDHLGPPQQQQQLPSQQQQLERGGIPQKHFGVNSSGGAAGGMSNFRERSNMQRASGNGGGSFHNNYSNDRRFESHRTAGSSSGTNNVNSSTNIPSSYTLKDADIDRDRDRDADYGRHMGHKFDYNRRDERMNLKYNTRERDISEDHNKSSINKAPGESGRYLTISREMQKDNEYSSAVRVRGSNDY